MTRPWRRASSQGYGSAFQGLEATQANAEAQIQSIMNEPVWSYYGRTVDVYGSTGRGLRFDSQSGDFMGFLEGKHASR